MINADQSALWAADIAASVKLMNDWFKIEAPKVFRAERAKTAVSVKDAMAHSADLSNLTPELLRSNTGILPALRMLAAGESIKAVSQQLGHGTIDITLRVYAYLLPEADEALAGRLQKMFG